MDHLSIDVKQCPPKIWHTNAVIVVDIRRILFLCVVIIPNHQVKRLTEGNRRNAEHHGKTRYIPYRCVTNSKFVFCESSIVYTYYLPS